MKAAIHYAFVSAKESYKAGRRANVSKGLDISKFVRRSVWRARPVPLDGPIGGLGVIPEVTDLVGQPAGAAPAALLVAEESVERELVELVEPLLLAGVEAVGGGLAQQLHRRRRRDHRHRVAARRRVEVVAAEARVAPRHGRRERHLLVVSGGILSSNDMKDEAYETDRSIVGHDREGCKRILRSPTPP